MCTHIYNKSPEAELTTLVRARGPSIVPRGCGGWGPGKVSHAPVSQQSSGSAGLESRFPLVLWMGRRLSQAPDPQAGFCCCITRPHSRASLTQTHSPGDSNSTRRLGTCVGPGLAPGPHTRAGLLFACSNLNVQNREAPFLHARSLCGTNSPLLHPGSVVF